METTFEKELEELINRHSQEKGSDTPDFILAQYLIGCLKNFNATVHERERWYGRMNDGISVINTSTCYSCGGHNGNHKTDCTAYIHGAIMQQPINPK